MVEVEDEVRNSFYEGWWRIGGVEVAEMGGSAVRRPVVDLLSTGRRPAVNRSTSMQGQIRRGREREEKGKEDLGIWGLK